MPLFHKHLFLALTLLVLTGLPALAGDTDPLFINVTTDDPHRALMAVSFGKNQLALGHPLTLFFNDKGVAVVSTANAATFPEHQKMIADVAAQGATVLVCPMCMKHFGLTQEMLTTGAQVGDPKITGPALFRENTKTLSW